MFWPTFARTNLYDSGMPQPGNHARASFQQRLHSAAECVAHFTLNIDSAVIENCGCAGAPGPLHTMFVMMPASCSTS